MLKFGNLVILGDKDEFNNLEHSTFVPEEVPVVHKSFSEYVQETGRSVLRSTNSNIINKTNDTDSPKPNVVRQSGNLKKSQYLQDIWGD